MQVCQDLLTDFKVERVARGMVEHEGAFDEFGPERVPSVQMARWLSCTIVTTLYVSIVSAVQCSARFGIRRRTLIDVEAFGQRTVALPQGIEGGVHFNRIRDVAVENL